MTATTAIVILNYNGEKFLRQFLPSVLAHSGDARVIVADNASTDSSLLVLKHEFPAVEVITFDQNYGFCGGYNRALKQISSDYYVLLNSDVEVSAGWLTPLIKLLDNDPSTAAVQPKILAWSQKDTFEYAGAGGGFLDALGYPFCRGRLFDVLEKDNGQYNDTREVFWASGACLVIRAGVYHTLGGLDEDFFAHMEEIDLCWRIHRVGQKVMYCGESTVFHVGAGTLSRSNPRKTYLNFRNGLALLFKNLPAFALLWKLPVRMLLDYVAALQFLLKGESQHARAVMRAHGHFMSALPSLSQKRRDLRIYAHQATLYPGSIVVAHFLLKKNRIELSKRLRQ
jgi:GT2 family glycosyltransferase